MKNWFENNQTKSVILYTLIISASTWACYKYMYEESKLELYKAQIESKQVELSQLQSRIEFLEKKNSSLEVVIKEFEDWNSKSQNPNLFYKTKFEEMASLKQKYQNSIALNSSSEDSIPKTYDTIVAKEIFPIDAKIYKGDTYINDKEQIVIAVNDVNVSRECDLILSVGNKKNESFKNVKVGKTFTYLVGKRKLRITLSKTEFITSWATFHITKENQK
ncbi:hypothetical protein [Flavobacterium denitrificans]|uniref:hypothetical protein n=1 Tax=Flavobacterium denitrificans TaxID=281361 RepID=UPI00042A710B|nr:hypothetical protein [Flavobacterium denitrificans]